MCIVRSHFASLQDSFASGSGGGSGKYLESGVVLTIAGIEETKKMLASKRESDRLEGLKRVIAVSLEPTRRAECTVLICATADDDQESARDVVLPTGHLSIVTLDTASSAHPDLAIYRALRRHIARTCAVVHQRVPERSI